MNKTAALLLAIPLYLGSLPALHAEEIDPPLASLEVAMSDCQCTALTLRLSLLEALRHLHWEITAIERDKIVATYDGRRIEVNIAGNQSVMFMEQLTETGKRVKRDWLPNLQKVLVDYVRYNNMVEQIKGYYPAGK